MLLGMALLLGFGSCEKKMDLKRPTPVSFQLTMNQTGNVAPDRLVLQSGTMVLQSFSIRGKRAGMDEVLFTRYFPQGLVCNLPNANFLEDLEFELPQGTYEELVVSFQTRASTTRPSILLNGSYTYSNPVKLPSTVRLSTYATYQFELPAKRNGQAQLVLDHQQAEQASLVLYPRFWFEDVSTTMLENASFNSTGGQQVIEINTTTNTSIFALVEAAIGAKTVCEF